MEVGNIKAVLVVDIQKEYMKQYDENLLTAINYRIREAVMKNELVVYIKNVRCLKRGKVINEFADGLDVCTSHVFYKEKASVFSDEQLLTMLRKNKVSEIEVIGIDGCCCVARSAMDAQALGFKVSMPCSYIGVKNQERFEKKKMLLRKQGICISE